MNTLIEKPRQDDKTPEDARLAVVVVAPRGALSDCDLAIASALSHGAVTFTCEVPAGVAAQVSEEEFAFGLAIEAIGAAVDRANRSFPRLPIVLVGHADAGIPAQVYADLYPDELAGVVLTQNGGQEAA